MKKIIVALIIIVSLLSCEDDRFIAATSQIDWTQVPDFTSETSTLVVVYSIQNTGKEPITGYSIVFSIDYGGGISNYYTRDSRHISQANPSILPAGNATNSNCLILQGEILVDKASFKLGEGTVIQDVQLARLRIWSEHRERIYEY
jgi:hypothetical protein